MIKTDIVIIDSGISVNEKYERENCRGLGLFVENENLIVTQDFDDRLGHGTAIFSIIKKYVPRADIFVIKIFDISNEISEKNLIRALEYVRDNVSCKVVNMSLGIRNCINERELEQVCLELSARGIILVSAFDNDGAISFPAAFNCVIGVDGNGNCKNSFDFEYVEGSVVNIRAKGGIQRVKWKNNKTAIIGGSSFACAYVAAYVSRMILDEQRSMNLRDVLHELKNVALKIYHNESGVSDYEGVSSNIIMRSIAIFPFNKEMHAIARFNGHFGFEINSVYDVRQSGRVGANTNKILGVNNENGFTILDICNIEYENIDCMVLGHLEEINNLLGRDLRKDIIMSCINKNVNVYSFDSLDYCRTLFNNKQCSIFWPSAKNNIVPKNNFGKLYGISKPVIGIWGTSSCQGKFTLQLILKELFEKSGYNVGCIGTEPHALLFGMDYVYPMGYNSAIYVDDKEAICLINKMLHDLCFEKELIIVGSQANTIPYNFLNTSVYHSNQSSFLLGTQPDVIILCINLHDNTQYIKNTIKFIEGLTNGKVIGGVVFPMTTTCDWTNVFNSKKEITQEEYDYFAKEINSELGIKLYILGVHQDMINLQKDIISYFT